MLAAMLVVAAAAAAAEEPHQPPSQPPPPPPPQQQQQSSGAAAAPLTGCHAWPYFNQTVCWPPSAVTRWACTELNRTELAPGVAWTRRRCSMSTLPPPWFTQRPHRLVPPGVDPAAMPWNASAWLVGPVILNVVEANLSAPGVRAVPGVADPALGTAPVPDIARYNNNATAAKAPTLLAGVNGGYFFRVDLSSFHDDVCVGKNRSQALSATSAEHPSDGTGDTLVKIDGEYLSRNCDNVGLSRPAALVLPDGSASAGGGAGVGPAAARIEVLHRGQDVSGSPGNVIAASPNLLTAGRIDIPVDDDNTGNIEEHAANTGVGLRDGGGTLVMATVDGVDDW